MFIHMHLHIEVAIVCIKFKHCTRSTTCIGWCTSFSLHCLLQIGDSLDFLLPVHKFIKKKGKLIAVFIFMLHLFSKKLNCLWEEKLALRYWFVLHFFTEEKNVKNILKKLVKPLNWCIIGWGWKEIKKKKDFDGCECGWLVMCTFQGDAGCHMDSPAVSLTSWTAVQSPSPLISLRLQIRLQFPLFLLCFSWVKLVFFSVKFTFPITWGLLVSNWKLWFYVVCKIFCNQLVFFCHICWGV